MNAIFFFPFKYSLMFSLISFGFSFEWFNSILNDVRCTLKCVIIYSILFEVCWRVRLLHSTRDIEAKFIKLRKYCIICREQYLKRWETVYHRRQRQWYRVPCLNHRPATRNQLPRRQLGITETMRMANYRIPGGILSVSTVSRPKATGAYGLMSMSQKRTPNGTRTEFRRFTKNQLISQRR